MSVGNQYLSSNLSNKSTSGPNQLLLQVFVLLGAYKLLQKIKTPCNTSNLPGQMYITELLDGNDEQMDMMQMRKPIFKVFSNQIPKTPVDTVSRLLLEEQVAIFLYTVGHSSSNRATQDQFQHSSGTILRYVYSVLISSLLSITNLKKVCFFRVFHYVLSALVALSQKYIKSPTPGIIHPCISSNPKLHKYFD
ncbi:uncharacterized protein VP01_552g2 [Puccinia sorghi]|uniref:DUF8040 domain-containing protein n=1 Tax=Puccinia sorghi TaxID=27349 RepID=A0A0L6UJC7_9BASI|nr:uncharacterized protein VP01_552g2 [Puccinia sorghi]